MARGGITKKSVEQARNALIARGESVSIDAVRIELGNTGSKTTIHRYLKELETDDDKTALSASLSDELIALVNQLSSRLKAEANQTLEAQEERHSEVPSWLIPWGDSLLSCWAFPPPRIMFGSFEIKKIYKQ